MAKKKIADDAVVTSLYPPSSANSIKELLGQILSNKRLDRLKKYSFIYYLYLDLSLEAATQLATSLSLPPHFRTMLTAFHNLDTLNLSAALLDLTHPAVFPNYTPQILQLFVRCASSAEEGARLATIFAQVSARPGEMWGGSPKGNAYWDAVKKTDIGMAFRVLRGMFPGGDGPEKRAYLHDLVAFCLSGNVSAAVRSERCLALLALPVSAEEDAVVEEWLRENGGEVARDTLLVKQMFKGAWREALENTRGNPGKRIEGVNWEDLVGGVQDRVGDRLVTSE